MTASPVVAEDVLAQLRAVRDAARSIARNESLGSARYVALVRLVERFQDGDPWFAAAVRRIVWAEGGELLEFGRTPKAPEPSWNASPQIRALWNLRRTGHEFCPTCSRPVPAADTLAKLEDQDRAVWVEALAREGDPRGRA